MTDPISLKDSESRLKGEGPGFLLKNDKCLRKVLSKNKNKTKQNKTKVKKKHVYSCLRYLPQ